MKFKIILSVFAFIANFASHSVSAGGLSTSLTASSSSAPQGGNVTVTFREYLGTTGYPGYNVSFSLSGAASSLSAYSGVTDSNGYVIVTLTDSAAGNVTVTATQTSSEVPGPYTVGEVTVNFVAPVPPPAQVTPAPTPSPSPSKSTTPKPTPSSTPKVTPSATPVTSPEASPPPFGSNSFASNDKSLDSRKPFSIESGKSFTVSGKTLPNGIVTLTIHSTPRTAKVTADAQGIWSYVVSGLEEGAHKIEAFVTDPITHLNSSTTTLASFNVNPLAKSRNLSEANTKFPNASKSVALAGIFVLAGIIVWFLISRRAKKTKVESASPTVKTPEEV